MGISLNSTSTNKSKSPVTITSALTATAVSQITVSSGSRSWGVGEMRKQGSRGEVLVSVSPLLLCLLYPMTPVAIRREAAQCTGSPIPHAH
ncbi:MAG: hypothetical protein ACYT04_50240 [Nostoc sp.]